jgi:hypothetical protein
MTGYSLQYHAFGRQGGEKRKLLDFRFFTGPNRSDRRPMNLSGEKQ